MRLYTCKYPEINEQLYLHLKKEHQLFAFFLSSQKSLSKIKLFKTMLNHILKTKFDSNVHKNGVYCSFMS